MTQKELSYVEDAIGHEENIIKIMREEINNLDDEEVLNFLEKEINIHSSLKEKLMNLLKEKSNE